MDRARLRTLLTDVQTGAQPVERAEELLTALLSAELGYAHLDLHRPLRTGHPEIVYGEGKTSEQILGILERLHQTGHEGLVTRVDSEKARAVVEALPDVRWHTTARLLHRPASEPAHRPAVAGTIAVICAGTSDLPVAEEAAVLCEALGNPVLRLRDVGVAGLHRLLGHLEALRAASVHIVVAGMEGALPSVVAGLVDRPVIAVPTSVGYGASFGGVAALLGMLNACAGGVSVVNIDNGVGAALVAARFNRAWTQP